MDQSLDKIKQARAEQAEAARRDKEHQEKLDSSKSLESVLFQSFQSLVAVLQGNGTKAEAITMVVNALEKLDKETDDNKTELAVIKSGLTTLEQQLKEIPANSLKQIPKFLERPDTFKINNLDTLEKGVKRVEDAVSKIKVNVEAPVVNVPAPKVTLPAPVVNVAQTDLTPLLTTAESTLKAIKAVKLPKADKVDLTKLEKAADKQLKLLQKLLEKPVGGGGGGGGRATPYQDAAGIPAFVTLNGGSIPVTVSGGSRSNKVQQATTITSSTAETTVLTAVAATYLDVYAAIVTNTSDTSTEVAFKDDTGGTTRFTISAPANDTRGFMLPSDSAHNQSAVNDNWTATCADSVASILITVMAVKAT